MASKGNFIHTYNSSALIPDLETVASEGTDTTTQSSYSARELNESELGSPRSRSSSDNGGRNEVARGRSELALRDRATSSQNVSFLRRWWNSHVACCWTAQGPAAVGRLQMPEDERGLLWQDEFELGFDRSPAACESPRRYEPVSPCEENVSNSRIVPVDTPVVDCPSLAERNNDRTHDFRDDDVASTSSDEMPREPELPSEVLEEVDAVVRNISEFLELRKSFGHEMASIYQRECAANLFQVESFKASSSPPTSPIPPRFCVFLRACVFLAHLDPSSLLLSRGSTASIVCSSFAQMNTLLNEILSRVESTVDMALVALENNVHTAHRVTRYPSIIVTIRLTDGNDGERTTSLCRVELHHVTLHAIQEHHRGLYTPFANLASSPHAVFLNRLLIPAKKCRAKLWSLLRDESRDVASLRALRVLLALLAGEPDSGALGERVLACLVRAMPLSREPSYEEVQNAYAAILHRKAKRLIDVGEPDGDQWDEAERILTEALHVVRPPKCPKRSAPILHDYACLRERRGHLADAELLLTRALTFHGVSPTTSPVLIDTAHRLSLVLRQQGKATECSALCQEWGLSAEDVEHELKQSGKLPLNPGSRRRRGVTKCLHCGLAPK